MRRPRTSGQQWWYGGIERRAASRLVELQLRQRGDGSGLLWDGRLPVPVELIAEHLLGLSVVYDEAIEEPDGETIFGSLRTERREIVLNVRHADRFRDNPGLERHTIAHECGHADLFGEAANATEQTCVSELLSAYRPRKRWASRGDVWVLLPEILRGRSPAVRHEVVRQLREEERERMAEGEDSLLVRRAVSHYAAHLLMPADRLREEVRGLDLSRWSSITQLARRFLVSKESMRIQLEEVDLIHGVDEHNRIVLADPKEVDQLSLL